MTGETTPSGLEVPDAPPAWSVPATVLAIIFGLLHAWFFYQALGNLLNVPPAYAAAGVGDRTPWAILIVGLILPVLAFTGAALLGVRRTLSNRVLLFAAGLAATSATAFSLYVASAYLVSLS